MCLIYWKYDNFYLHIIMLEEATAVLVLRSHVINSLIGMLLMDKIVENISEKYLVFWDFTINERNL